MSDNEKSSHIADASKMAHAPCRHRRRETRNGVTMDWCYGIGAFELGDLPCEYCADRKRPRTKGKATGPK